MSLMVKFGLDSKSYEAGLQRLKATTKQFADDTQKGLTGGRLGFLRAAGGAGVLAAGVAGASLAMVAGMKRAMEWGSTISDQALEAQMSVESLQTLLAVGLDAGRGQDVILTALRAFNNRIAQAADGAKVYQQAIEKMGYSTEDFLKLPVDRRFEELARYYAEATDKTTAYNNVVKLLGEDAAPKLLEVLNRIGVEGFSKINKELKDTGRIIDDGMVQSLDKAEDAFNRMMDAVQKRLIMLAGDIAKLAGFGEEGDVAKTASKFTKFLGMGPAALGGMFGASLASKNKDKEEGGLGGVSEKIELVTSQEKIAEFQAKKGAEDISKGFLSGFQKFKDMVPFMGSSGLGEFQESTFKNPAVTSLTAIGGGNANGMSMQMKQIDILERIEKNTREQKTVTPTRAL